jgi:hypothetical protein
MIRVTSRQQKFVSVVGSRWLSFGLLRLIVSRKFPDVSGVLTASIIKVMMVTPLKRRSVSTRLHDAASQKSVSVLLRQVACTLRRRAVVLSPSL